jgi:hypothetical protein
MENVLVFLGDFNKIMAIIVSLISFLIIFFLQYRNFTTRRPPRDASVPSTFFDLSGLVRPASLRTLGVIFSLPFAALFFIISIDSKPLTKSAHDFLVGHLLTYLNPQLQQKGIEFFQSIPEYLSPLFVLVVTMMLFAPYLNKPLDWFSNLVFYVLSIDGRSSRIAMDAAESVLKQTNLANARALLEKVFGQSPPLPPELASQPDQTQLAYQLLYFSQPATQTEGLEVAINGTIGKMQLNKHPVDPYKPNIYPYFTAAIVFYSALCILYIILTPLLEPWITESTLVTSFFGQITWPDRDHLGILAVDVIQASCAYVMPLAIGMNMFAMRRREWAKEETLLQTYIMVFQVVFLLAIFAKIVIAFFFVLRNASGEASGQISLFETKVLVEIFLAALAPCAALLAWCVLGGERINAWLATVVLCVSSAVSLYLCQLAYESISTSWSGYYWHQMVLGTFVTASYLIAASAALGFGRPDPNAAPIAKVPLGLMPGSKPAFP